HRVLGPAHPDVAPQLPAPLDRERRHHGRPVAAALDSNGGKRAGSRSHSPSHPTSSTSSSNSMPNRSRTLFRARSIRLLTSSALASPRLTMKLPWTVEISAPPIRVPLSPAASISRPAQSPGGFLKTLPELGIPRGCLLRRRAANSFIRAVTAC